MTYQVALYLISNAFRVFLIFYFFSIFYKAKRATLKIFITYGIVFFITTNLIYLIFDIPLLTIGCNLLFLYGTGFLYKGNWQKYIFLPLANFSIGIFTECIVAFFPMINYEKVQDFYIGITSLLTNLLYMVVIILIKKIARHDEILPWQYWASLFSFPVLSIIILCTLILEYTISPLQLVIIFTVLAIFNIVIFWLYDQTSAYFALRQELYIAKEQVESYSTLLFQQQQSEDTIRGIRHDLRDHLNYLRTYLKVQDLSAQKMKFSMWMM